MRPPRADADECGADECGADDEERQHGRDPGAATERGSHRGSFKEVAVESPAITPTTSPATRGAGLPIEAQGITFTAPEYGA
jgi:hypothetical protein